MSLSRRSFLQGLGALPFAAGTLGGSLLPTLWSTETWASSMRGLSLSELSQSASLCCTVRAVLAQSEWSTLGGHRRIITRTRVLVEDYIFGGDGQKEREVLTLGGRVGDLGQKALGEAELPVDQSHVLFLRSENGLERVVGMSQGAYQLEGPHLARSLRRSRNLPALFRAPSSKLQPAVSFAVQDLDGLALNQARPRIVEAHSK